jgi:hypothetical protein
LALGIECSLIRACRHSPACAPFCRLVLHYPMHADK